MYCFFELLNCLIVGAFIAFVRNLFCDEFDIVTEEESGLIDFSLKENYSKEAVLLIRSMVLGLQGIQNNYGNEYITLIFKEV